VVGSNSGPPMQIWKWVVGWVLEAFRNFRWNVYDKEGEIPVEKSRLGHGSDLLLESRTLGVVR